MDLFKRALLLNLGLIMACGSLMLFFFDFNTISEGLDYLVRQKSDVRNTPNDYISWLDWFVFSIFVPGLYLIRRSLWPDTPASDTFKTLTTGALIIFIIFMIIFAFIAMVMWYDPVKAYIFN